MRITRERDCLRDLRRTYLPTIPGFMDYPGKSRDFIMNPGIWSIYLVIDILLKAIEAYYMDNKLQKSLKHI